MIYVLLGLAVVAVLVWAGRRSPLSEGRSRLAAGIAATLAFVAGALVAARGQMLGGAILLTLGAWLAPLARPPRAAQPRSEPMGQQEARDILGVEPNATREEIQAAYRRLMRRAHPDQGGTSGLAAKLNAARERLLKN